MGNPGVPAGGHGIGYQGAPGGSPSAVEVDGQMGGQQQQHSGPMGASMNQPYSEGPYEMGHGGR